MSKFYALTETEVLQMNSKLKDHELRVWLWLITRNETSIENIDIALISEYLGLSRKVAQRALRRLKELNILE